MNDGYFFELLNKMKKDVQTQPASRQKRDLVHKLDSIQEAATPLTDV